MNYPMTYCSQCGSALGPGTHGVSDCERHEPRLGMIKANGPALLSALRVMLDTFADDGDTPPDEAIKQARETVNTAIGMEPDGLTLNPAAWEAVVQDVKVRLPSFGVNDFLKENLGEPFALTPEKLSKITACLESEQRDALTARNKQVIAEAYPLPHYPIAKF